mmetsp:Transcript_5889/g.15307  ORF Transcript_5889/g.15307 Transcript_5889/m.15307 type:complete len:342 (-) Transcript_5889:1411-2436(-)
MVGCDWVVRAAGIALLALAGGAKAADHVSVFGLGAMGCAAAAELADAEDVELTVWNRSPGRCAEELDGKKVTRAGTIREAMATAEVAVFMLPTVDHVISVFEDDEIVEAAKGTTIVAMSSASIQGAARQEQFLKTKVGDDHVLGGAMMCPPSGFKDAGCPFWVGGTEAAVAKVGSALSKLGPLERISDTAAAVAAYDMALVSTFQQLVNAALTSLAVVTRAGFDAKFAADQIGTIIPAMFPLAIHEMETGLRRSYDDYVREGIADASVQTHSAFNDINLETCHDAGVSSCAIYDAAAKLYKPLIDAGHSSLHVSAIYDALVDPTLAALTAAADGKRQKTEL